MFRNIALDGTAVCVVEKYEHFCNLCACLYVCMRASVCMCAGELMYK
jgi:hypothetical protein